MVNILIARQLQANTQLQHSQSRAVRHYHFHPALGAQQTKLAPLRIQFTYIYAKFHFLGYRAWDLGPGI